MSREAPDISGQITLFQLRSIGICFLMNMLDGMNVMVMSYAAPAISRMWGVEAGLMGLVFSAGLLGMAVGAMVISPQADQLGRRTLILICALLMGMSIALTALAPSVYWLILLRIVSGMGIGGMLASTATLAAEYAPKRGQDFWVSLVMGGYPLGAVLSGIGAAWLIPARGWESAFLVAGVITLLTIPLVALFLEESLAFLLKKQPPGALDNANRILVRIHRPLLEALPVLPISPPKGYPVAALLHGRRRSPTVMLWTALFMAFATLYFLTSWIPRLADSAGLSMELAIYAGTVFNLGAFAGILLQGYLSGLLGLRRTIAGFLFATAVFMSVFGLFPGSAMVLLLFGMIGLGVQGGFVGLYAVAARLYPVEIRTTGVGWAIGLGRVGGIVGPAAGGLLAGMDFTMVASFWVFAVPLLIGSWATLSIVSPEVP